MINLLPNDVRKSITYARRNKLLVRWTFAAVIGLSGILIIVVFGLFYIDTQIKQIDKQVQQSHQDLKTQKIDETQKRVEEMSSSFKLVTDVLSRQVLFSEALMQIGAVMPPGATLATLNVEELSGGLDINVNTIDQQTASQVQVNLEDPANKLFENADIISINCSDNPEEKYPCVGRYRVLFAKENPFLFLNKQNSGDKNE